MKAIFLFAVRAILLVTLICCAIVAASRLLPALSDTPIRAAALDAKAQHYQNVIVVARSGGDFGSVQKALNSIADNSPSHTWTSRVLGNW